MLNGVKKLVVSIERYLTPLFDFGVRGWIAYIFFLSGWKNAKDWQVTLLLYEHEYHLPEFLSPDIIAYIATGFELVCPVLLLLGLAARFAAFLLFIVAMSIHFFHQPLIEHYYWMCFLGLVFFHGPGRLSLDGVLRRQFFGYERRLY